MLHMWAMPEDIRTILCVPAMLQLTYIGHVTYNITVTHAGDVTLMLHIQAMLYIPASK